MQTTAALIKMTRTIARVEAELSPEGTWKLRGIMTDGTEFAPPAAFKMTRQHPQDVIDLVVGIETYFNTSFLLVRGKSRSAACFYTTTDSTLEDIGPKAIFERSQWHVVLSSVRPFAS